ncbi:MAG: hypothetical protein ACRC62_35800 [Microcoleus sp.]
MLHAILEIFFLPQRKSSAIEFPIPNPQLLIPNPQSPIPNPQSPIPNPQFPIHNSQFPIHNYQKQAQVNYRSHLID